MQKKGQEHIFTNARDAINNLTARLIVNHGFSVIEAKWRVTMVNTSEIMEENEVKFVVSQKVKDLIEKQFVLDAYDERKEQINFVCIREAALWEISVKALGVESYYFARMLFYGVNSLARRQRDKDTMNCKLINMYIEFARAKTMGLPKKIRIDSGRGKHSLSFANGKSSWQKSINNIDALCAYIGRRFKGYVEF